MSGILSLPRVVGHRGAARHAPENTLAGIRVASEIGATWVEFDVQLTRDDQCVVIHDPTLERTTNGRGRVRDHDLDALRSLDAGAWFAPAFAGEPLPSLAEVIDLLGERGMMANIELKSAPGATPDEIRILAHATARVVERHWPKDRPLPLVSSFSPELLAAIAEAAPDLPRGGLVDKLPSYWREAAAQLGLRTIHPDWRHLTADQAREIKEAGYGLLVYTVNDPAVAERLFGWGVDSIITDVPDAILALKA